MKKVMIAVFSGILHMSSYSAGTKTPIISIKISSGSKVTSDIAMETPYYVSLFYGNDHFPAINSRKMEINESIQLEGKHDGKIVHVVRFSTNYESNEGSFFDISPWGKDVAAGAIIIEFIPTNNTARIFLTKQVADLKSASYSDFKKKQQAGKSAAVTGAGI